MVPPRVELELGQRARRDVLEAIDWLARQNTAAANELRTAILRTLRQLERWPEVGARIPGDPGQHRSLTIPKFRGYRLFYAYDPDRGRLRVVRFLHGSRDWPEEIHGETQ